MEALVSNIIPFYQSTLKHRVILDDLLLDYFADQFQKRKDTFSQMNFEQWVEFKMWELSKK